MYGFIIAILASVAVYIYHIPDICRALNSGNYCKVISLTSLAAVKGPLLRCSDSYSVYPGCLLNFPNNALPVEHTY